ncbi:Torsin-4A [Frankliniella fusca]|uniref:Torsin-4A n=1 Tax=Frankliniella fusca TaxID=407009 RepID=A0AAE1LGE6_9NEOP|nr:Torsin-4A [Frankliniella fusca]
MAIVRKMSKVPDASGGDDDSPLVSGSSSHQPFIFRQFIFREIVTPTKKGNVSMKEISFSTYCDDKWTSVSQKTKGFSFSLKKMLMPPKETCPPHVSFTASKPNIIDLALEKSSSLRSRPKTVQPLKKMKVDSIVDQKIPKDKRHTRRRCGPRENPRKLHWNHICLISLIPVVMLLGSSIYIFKDRNMQLTCNLNHLQSILNERVFGQREAISSILNIIETTINKASINLDLENNKEMPIILITGPSGVGKSYASSIIASGFPPPGISDLILFPLPPPKNTVQKCSEKGYNLIVLDSLYNHSINNSINWVKKFSNEALWQNKPAIVMLIFSVQVWNAPTDIAQEKVEAEENVIYSDLKRHGLETFHVHFRSLSKEDLKNCVKVALQRKGVGKDYVTEENVNMIADSIDHREEGCKRVWSQTASAVFD